MECDHVTSKCACCIEGVAIDAAQCSSTKNSRNC